MTLSICTIPISSVCKNILCLFDHTLERITRMPYKLMVEVDTLIQFLLGLEHIHI